MLILGIETSCDETAAAVVENGKKILSNVVASQVDLHRKFWGIVPEIASRKHLELIIPIIKESLGEARIKLKDLDAVAATYGPGLLGSLLVGLIVAKGLAYALELPFIGINHLEAHFYANFLSYPEIVLPLVGLIISGGHTELIYLSKEREYEILGTTRDDAVGEAFDKVARILDLGYPGGPVIEKMAEKGNPQSIKLPLTHFKNNSLDFSFSGIKTAVLYYVKDLERKKAPVSTADIAASFQLKIAQMLSKNLFKVACLKKVKQIILGGGVSANLFLRSFLEKEKPDHIKIFFPPLELCTDNAAMVAACAYPKVKQGKSSPLSLDAQPNLGF
ncbi:tRNA (adenosine(37)-N6)-threonylcarbamoyltransferase complex transferase subunit TsaD [Candidatus Aerophobetes bacterium Ae_b3b]|nr:MAG: tRNA (adenosine(37)-N6)-threonylcarbamoyltransferase complex transferase subunit TsaD [Candidatus Aerophobetes bacterium Ae_b3b]